MSVFWKYFHDTLRWPAIFRPGPLSALVKGLALYMDDVRADMLWLRRQYVPARCDEDLIARYGESRGIVRWRFDTDESYRRRVINAFAWHKLGGKVRGLERIFAENLYIATILPASDPALWAHFRLGLDVTGTGFDQDSAALAFWLANEYKPARSKLEEIVTKSTNPLPVAVALGGVSRTLTRPRIWFPPVTPPCLPIRAAAASRSVTRADISPVGPAPRPPRPRRMAGFAARTITRSAICPMI